MAKYITKLGWDGEVYDIRDKAAHEKIDNIEIPDMSNYYPKGILDVKLHELDEKIDAVEVPDVDLSNYYNKTEIDTKLENVETECAPQFGLVKKGQSIPNEEGKVFFIFEDTHDGATYMTITANIGDGYRVVIVKNMKTGEEDGDMITNNGGGTITLHIYAHKTDTVLFGYADEETNCYLDEEKAIQIPVQTELTINDTNEGWVITNAEIEMKIMINCPNNSIFWAGIKNQTTGIMLADCGPYMGNLHTVNVKPTDEIRVGSANDDYDGGLSDTDYVVVPVRTDGKITPVNYNSGDNTWTVGEPYMPGEATVS